MSGPASTLSAPMLAGAIKARARELGFNLVGIAPTDASAHESYWRAWAADGRAGDMGYMVRRLEERVRPATYFPGARSAICVAINYHVPLAPAAAGETARIARYALGTDYHDAIRDKLFTLADYVKQAIPAAETRCAVDTAPVPERELAARAGIGWVGKNTCVISPKIGSWLFLGTVLTTAELPTDRAEADHCGSCTRCLIACPTGALSPERPYELDPRKCISYLTIEHRTDIADDLQPALGDWLYGCDICQDVCPHNRKPPAATEAFLQPRVPSGKLNPHEVLSWESDTWLAFSRKTAIRRLGLPLLKRNAAIVAGNVERRETAHAGATAPFTTVSLPDADARRPK